jgi:hypothetical protein
LKGAGGSVLAVFMGGLVAIALTLTFAIIATICWRFGRDLWFRICAAPSSSKKDNGRAEE